MTLNTYLEKMSEASGISIEMMTGPSRRREACASRHILWTYLSRKEKWSTSRIGLAFNRDHATVLNGIKRASDYRDNRRGYAMEAKLWEEFETIIQTN